MLYPRLRGKRKFHQPDCLRRNAFHLFLKLHIPPSLYTLTITHRLGRLSRVENERRDDPRHQSEAPSPEPSYRDDDRPGRESAPQSGEHRETASAFDRPDEPYEPPP